jgi:hypothetical protein
MSTENNTQIKPMERHSAVPIQALSIDSMLKDLPSHMEVVSLNAPGKDLYDRFTKKQHLPGVLIEDQGKLVGLISRETFFERTGTLWGTEIYLSRPVGKLLRSIPHKPMILPETTLISMAVSRALSRSTESLFQPVVVQSLKGSSRIISSQVLFIAQSQILINLHRQRQFTFESGVQISEQEAVMSFLKYTQPGKTDPMLCFERTSVRCPRCERDINYSIIDIIRSHPQINRVILIEERMGLRVFWMYVRHKCLNEIWEIPVLHDSRLKYRSQRQPRPVESYV